MFDFAAIIGKIAIRFFIRSVDDAHSDFFGSQSCRVRDFDAQLAFDVCLDVDRAVFWVLTRLSKDMVRDVIPVGLFVFAFVESMTSVVGVEGPNLPELRLFDACSIQTPWATIGFALDGIVLVV